MSTRSAVGTLDKSGHFKGRYVHHDGYPKWLGVKLIDLVHRDGVDKVLDVLTEEHYGWSSINPDETEGKGRADDRFLTVPNYGEAYTTNEGQIFPDDWVEFGPGGGSGWGTEWHYALEPEHLVVFDYTTQVGIVRYDDPAYVSALAKLEDQS